MGTQQLVELLDGDAAAAGDRRGRWESSRIGGDAVEQALEQRQVGVYFSHHGILQSLPMRSPQTVRAAEAFSRTRLSPNFFMRDFLFSEIAAIEGMRNLPANPDLAIEVGRRLCTELLEPLQPELG